jgi:hypothetical protein
VSDLVWALVVLAFFAAALAPLAWIRNRARRRGLGDGMMSVFEEMWHPGAARALRETRHQDERPAPAPLPGDRLFDEPG